MATKKVIPQTFSPRIESTIPREVQRHLQLIYDKLNNHALAFAALPDSSDTATSTSTGGSGGGSRSATPTGGAITLLIGDVTATGPGAAAATLASTGVTPASYTDADITVDSKGRILAAANGSAITELTGDVTATGPGSVPATLADTGVTAASYTRANITVDTKGRVTVAADGGGITALTGDVTASGTDSVAATVTATHLASPLPVAQGGSGTATPAIVAGTNVTVSGSWPNQTINATGGGGGITALTGDVTASGSGSVVATLSSTAVTPGSYTAANITVDGKGRVTAAANGSGSPTTTKGDLAGFDTASARVPVGADGQVLTADSTQALGLAWAASPSGFANPMTTSGDLIVGGSSGTAGRLGVGSTGDVLTVVSGAPAWAAGGGGSAIFFGQGAATSAANTTITLDSTPLAGSILIFSSGVLVDSSLYTVSGAVITLTAGSFGVNVVSAFWATANSTPGGITLSGSGPNPLIRGTGMQASSSSSYTVSWPAGTVAGDLAIICAGHGFAINTPAGWTSNDNQAGSFWNGCVCSTVLTSTDIANGSVVVTASGGFDGAIAIVTMQGSTGGIREVDAQRNGSGSSITLNTSSAVTGSDTAIYFGSNRASSVDTVNRGTQQQQVDDGSQASGCLYTEAIATAGTVTAIVSYSSPGAGNYQAIVIVEA